MIHQIIVETVIVVDNNKEVTLCSALEDTKSLHTYKHTFSSDLVSIYDDYYYSHFMKEESGFEESSYFF